MKPKPLFKIGDIVAIKPKYDPKCSEESYRHNFVDSMLRMYGGKRLKVIGITGPRPIFSYQIPDDGFTYDLGNLNTGESSGYSWSSSMFKNHSPLRRYPNLF